MTSVYRYWFEDGAAYFYCSSPWRTGAGPSPVLFARTLSAICAQVRGETKQRLFTNGHLVANVGHFETETKRSFGSSDSYSSSASGLIAA